MISVQLAFKPVIDISRVHSGNSETTARQDSSENQKVSAFNTLPVLEKQKSCHKNIQQTNDESALNQTGIF
jgi:hypothetical protein